MVVCTGASSIKEARFITFHYLVRDSRSKDLGGSGLIRKVHLKLDDEQ